MNCRIALAIAVTPLLLTTSTAGWAATLHVDGSATGADDGSSWADAYVDLQSALGAAVAGDEIWVAGGTYTPTSGSDRTATFELVDAVALYGGFAGTETTVGERDIEANLTVLSGDLGVLDDAADNSYHVVTIPFGTITATVLDGFRIVDGMADGGVLDADGAGMHVRGAATIVNVAFLDNEAAGNGGGLYAQGATVSLSNVRFVANLADDGAGMYSSGSNFLLDGARFVDNEATSNGGGISKSGGDATLSDVDFDGNSAGNDGGGLRTGTGTVTLDRITFESNSAAYGGGLNASLTSGTPKMSNLVFVGNSADYGGGMHLTSTDVAMCNVTFHDNSAVNTGGAMRLSSSDPLVTNAVMWGNSAPTYSEVESIGSDPVFAYSLIAGSGGSGTGWDAALGTDGGNNIDTDPLFVDATSGDLRTVPSSPAFESGTGAPAGIALPATDRDGNPRFAGAQVDMGAYEMVILCPSSEILYVDADATGAGTGDSWSDAFTDLQDALAIAPHCALVEEIWVAEGTYLTTSTTDRSRSFVMVDGIGIYGGFDGTEVLRDEREVTAHSTVLSGKIGDPGDETDNSYRVVDDAGVGSTATLDGFTITGGYADDAVVNDGAGIRVAGSTVLENLIILSNDATGTGGGILFDDSDATVTNVVVIANSAAVGGGLYITSGNNSFDGVTVTSNDATSSGGGIEILSGTQTFTDLSLTHNVAVESGGGVKIHSSDTTVEGALIQNNLAWGGGAVCVGGGVYVSGNGVVVLSGAELANNSSEGEAGGLYDVAYGSTTVVNSLFLDNLALEEGGAVVLRGATEILNCTFASNIAGTEGGALYVGSGYSPMLTNSILWENFAPFGTEVYVDGTPTFSHCLIAGSGGSGAFWDASIGIDGGSNLDADPLFVDLANDDPRLTYGSPATDVGDATVVGLPADDLDGNARMSGDGLDLGAYELDLGLDVLAIEDVANDQGRNVRIQFESSFRDEAGSLTPIVAYEAYRRNDDLPDPDARIPGWEFVGSIPAHGESEYLMVVPTLADSTLSQGMHWTTFFIRAATDDPVTFFDSKPDSGYSVDNLAPAPPGSPRMASPGLLEWDDPIDADFDYFTVYGSESDARDGSEVLIGHTSETSLEVGASSFSFYLVTGTDFSGNEGRAAATDGPSAGVEAPEAPIVMSLGVRPNPFNPTTTIRYAVPEAGRVTLAVYDIRGRRLDTLVAGEYREPNVYAVRYQPELASGQYYLRLEVGGQVRTRTLTLLQ